MNKALITLAATAALVTAGTVFAFSPVPPTTTVTVTGTGNNSVSSSTGASVSLTGIGSATSTATNVQSALSWVAGSGSLTSTPGSATISLENCEPMNVTGTLLTGSVFSSGGIQVSGMSNASVVTTGAGTGAAQAMGLSQAAVEGLTTLDSPNMQLSAGGNAAGYVLTDTGLVSAGGTDPASASATSSGSLAAGWNSSQTGTLLTFNSNGLTGDLKNISSTSTAYVGGIPTLVGGNECQPGECVVGDSVSVGPLTQVGGGANAFTGIEGFNTVTNQLALANTTVGTPPEVLQLQANNGLGNGDQTAPGNSLNSNSAENGDNDPHKKSGKPVVKN